MPGISPSMTLSKRLRRARDRFARRRQASERERRLRLRGDERRGRMQGRFLEPGIKLVAAAIALIGRRLWFAIGTVRRTSNADVEVLGMAIPWPHFLQPIPIRAGLAAQRLLDRGIDEDASHCWIPGGGADQRGISWRPDLRINIELIGRDDIGRRGEFALFAALHMVRHWREPDVGVQPNLMAGMARNH